MKGNAMNVFVGQPVYVTPLYQWGIVIEVQGSTVRSRLGDGNTVWTPASELSDEADPSRKITLTDAEGEPFTIGCGTIGGERMFWIDCKHEQITLVLSNEDQFIDAIREVLQ